MSQKTYRIALSLLLVLVIGTAATWWFLDSKPTVSDARISVSQGTNQDPSRMASNRLDANSATTKSSSAEALRSPVGQDGGRNSNSSGYLETLFNENARSLLSSTEPAKVDYGMLRSRTQCLSNALGNDAEKAVKEYGYSPATLKSSDVIAVGDAAMQIRVAAYLRSLERCRVFREPVMTDKEYAALTTLAAPSKALNIMRQLSNAKNFDDPEVKTALTQAVSGPMFGVLEGLIARSVDFSSLGDSYHQDQIATLGSLVGDLVLCRMGDDCAKGGVVNTQLCWQNGICGDNTEEAILANLRKRGLDTAALSQFVIRVQQALQSGDTSIFRKPKTGK